MLSFEGGKKGKTGAAKTSRHKKKYWRKGTNVTDFEDTLGMLEFTQFDEVEKIIKKNG